MNAEVCYWALCFVPAAKSEAPRIFGFAEFISSLALLVLVYTLIDIRYRFRIAVAPLPLYLITFVLIGIVGAEALLSEVWLAEGWWVPKTIGLTRAIWQSIFGALFLTTFMTWAWYAFIRPPIFCKKNAKRYANELYRVIVKGAESELSVIADEIGRSAMAMVRFSRSVPRRFGNDNHEASDEVKKEICVEDYAHDLLLLIANRKLCRHIIASAPATALAFFYEAVQAEKFHLPLGQFAKNISGEAISNRDSIMYHETDGFSSGLIGYIKPFSQTIYGNYLLVEGLAEHYGSPLDVDYREQWSWDAQQWKCYCRATVTTLESYLQVTGGHRHSFAICRALSDIEYSFRDLYKLNDIDIDYYSTDIVQRLNIAVDFVKDAAEIIDKQNPLPIVHKLRRRGNDHQKDIYDLLADFMFKIVCAASSISGPPDKAWSIHHNAVWGDFFNFVGDSSAWKILQFKLKRLLYDEIVRMDKMPNYKGAGVLGYCLNVLGLKVGTGTYGREYRSLTKAILAWTRRGYPILRKKLPDVASAVLIGSITYDETTNSLVKTYLKGLNTEPHRDILVLDNIEVAPFDLKDR